MCQVEGTSKGDIVVFFPHDRLRFFNQVQLL